MARTHRVGETRDGKSYECPFRRSYYCTEAAWARQKTNRMIRNAERLILADRRLDPDEVVIPPHPRTGGWLTH